MKITKEQIKEIELLIPKHKDALVNYGADMYNRGIKNGAGLCLFGIGVCLSIEKLVKYYKKRKTKQEES